MLEYLKNEANRTLTENGAATYRTSCSDCLDLFATIGALRHSNESIIINRFMRAYTENPDLAMKILFFARDVRGGLGERRVFRIILDWLAHNEKISVFKNISFIPEYGRYDDLLVLLDSDCESVVVALVKSQLAKDIEAMKKQKEISLLAKWLPSVNASNKETVIKAKKLSRMLGMSEAEYRKTLSELRSYLKLIENNLRERDYTFDYSKVPSKAMHKYIKAFYRNDNNRYSKYIASVERGEAKMNTSTLMPYELIEPYIKYSYYNAGSRSFMRPISEEEKASLNAAWNSLSDFCNDENALAVIDTSGSMYCTQNPMPASVALSLGLYFAEHNRGAFKNHFIEFSAEPRLIEIKGETFADKLRYVASFNEIGNTNLQSVFELLLKTATKNNIPQEEMPSKLYIISDMEFDGCIENADITNFEYAKSLFEQNGYKLPEVIFWNVESRNTQQPVKQNEQGVALVSGCTPRLFSMITSGELSPYKCMMEIIGSERYLKITA